MSKKNLKKAGNTAEKKEHLTNLYMIHLSLGVLGIIILLLFNNLYKNPATLVHMQTVTWILFAVFAVLCVSLILFGKNKKSVFKNIGIFSGISSIVFLWLSLFNKVRIVLENILRSITGNELLSVNSFWNIRIPIILIAAYLIIAFIVYCCLILKKDN